MAIRPSNPPLVLIAGPTASGKSALALDLAERTGGVIVNADSAQVYRELPILSAAPSPQEHTRADHRLFGYLDGQAPSSAAGWAERAKQEIREIGAAGRVPILVGGTGLYIRTLLEGIAPVPPIDPAIRQDVRESSVEANRARLEQHDPLSAGKLSPRDTARIARALEVVLSSGRPLSAWQQQREGGIGGSVTLQPLILLPPRDWLYARCDQRFATMVEHGAIREVKALLNRCYDPNLPIMRAIGVRELGAYLAGTWSLEEAVAAGQQATRRYAKRQYTWLAHQQPPEWPRLREPVNADLLPRLLELLETRA